MTYKRNFTQEVMPAADPSASVRGSRCYPVNTYRDLWDYLYSAVVAWIDKTPPPSLLPAAVPSG